MLMKKEQNPVDWYDFEHTLWERFGVNAVVFQPDGDRRTSGNVLLANDLCALIKKNQEAEQKICNNLKKRLMHKVRVCRKYAANECAAGMYRIMLPVIRNSEIEGYVSVCGRPFTNSNRIYTDYIQRVTGVDRETIQGFIPTLCPLGPQAVKEIKQFVTAYAA